MTFKGNISGINTLLTSANPTPGAVGSIDINNNVTTGGGQTYGAAATLSTNIT